MLDRDKIEKSLLLGIIRDKNWNVLLLNNITKDCFSYANYRLYDYIKSFAGIFPEESPKYIIYVSVKQMVGSTKDLSNCVKTAVEEIANYANINYKDEQQQIDTKVITLRNYINRNAEFRLSDENKSIL